MRPENSVWATLASSLVTLFAFHLPGSTTLTYDPNTNANTFTVKPTFSRKHVGKMEDVEIRSWRTQETIIFPKHVPNFLKHKKGSQLHHFDDKGSINKRRRDVDDAGVSQSPKPDDVTGSYEEDDPRFSMQTFVTILVTLLIVLTNCAVLLVAAWTEAFSNFNKTFIYSLAFADLLIGLFITPYSIFLSVYRRWVFSSDLFCSVGAYLWATLIAAKLYSLTWLSVDHYVAVRKPERYGVMMSPTRSFCWICFSWIVAISFCCPPLFSFTSANFSSTTYLCLVDAHEQLAYLLTAGVLVSAPPIVAITVTSCYLFTRSFKKRISFYEKVFVELSTRPRNYHITFILCALFALMWMPYALISVIKLEGFHVNEILEFFCCWLGISTGFTQFPVLFLLSPIFRDAMIEMCTPPLWFKRIFCFCCTDPVTQAPPDRDVNVIRISVETWR